MGCGGGILLSACWKKKRKMRPCWRHASRLGVYHLASLTAKQEFGGWKINYLPHSLLKNKNTQKKNLDLGQWLHRNETVRFLFYTPLRTSRLLHVLSQLGETFWRASQMINSVMFPLLSCRVWYGDMAPPHGESSWPGTDTQNTALFSNWLSPP